MQIVVCGTSLSPFGNRPNCSKWIKRLIDNTLVKSRPYVVSHRDSFLFFVFVFSKLQIFDFELSEEDMASLKSMDAGQRLIRAEA